MGEVVRGVTQGEGGFSSKGSHEGLMVSPQSRFELRGC